MKILVSIRNRFLAGLLILGPIGLTALVLRWIFNVFDGLVGPYLKEHVEWYFPGLGILFTVLAVYLIGLLTANLVGRKSIKLLDRIILRLPIIKVVYSTTKGIFQAFSIKERSNFKKAVFIQYPRKGLWTLAFVTGTTSGIKGEEFYSVFVPSTPLPTTGFVLFIKKNEVIDAKFSVEQGLKLLVSGGMVIPKKIAL